jgi:hypothetical protein
MSIAPRPRADRFQPGKGTLPPQPVPELDLAGSPAVPSRPVPPAALTSSLGTLVCVGVALGLSTLLAYQLTIRNGALVHNRMLPWILGRSLGLASYLTLTAAVALGIWIRHPWRNQLWSPRPESLLRAHVVAVAGTVVLLAGHLVSIAMDRYAGVGWTGAFVPWHAQYRATAVALGTLGLYGIVLIGGTAALAGWIGRRVWFPIHSTSAAVFCLCLVHGAMAGSDSHALRWVYVATGGMVAAALSTRWLVRQVGRRPSLELE